MPIAQQLLLKFPFFVLGLMIVGGAIVFSITGLLIVRHFVPHSRLRTHHDVADPILGALGMVYAVLLAFVVITVWQDFDRSSSNVQKEANYLADLYRNAEALSVDFREKVDPLLREYRQAVMVDEWKTMASGKMSPEVEKIMRKIWAPYTTYQPKNQGEQSFFDESVRKLNSFRELRRQRLMDSRTGIPSLLYFVLVVGAIFVISFTFLFGAENLKAQMIMGVMLAIMISLMMLTVISLDFPFTGSLTVSKEPFSQLILD
jgi:ABC-type antimicrobial peptide transport system permease subunit